MEERPNGAATQKAVADSRGIQVDWLIHMAATDTCVWLYIEIPSTVSDRAITRADVATSSLRGNVFNSGMKIQEPWG